MRDPRAILITGASSGIGEALALSYAASEVFLALTGRDTARLDAVVSACRAQGATVVAATVDAADASGMEAWIAEIDATRPIDLVIANAGISAGTGGGAEGADQTRQILRVNIEGVINTVLPLVPRMAARGRGQIALMSSMASFRGMPGAAAYSASKAFVRVWGEALRLELAPSGVSVSVICPGFVVSRITAANKFTMPLLMPASRAAGIIRRGLARNQPRIAFPRRIYAAVWLLAALPAALVEPLFARLPRKE